MASSTTLESPAPLPRASIAAPRGRGWSVAVLGLVVLYGAMVASVLIDGVHPSGYRAARMPEAAWEYPWPEVRFSLIAMSLETGVACLVLAWRTSFSIGARAALLGGLYACVMILFAPLTMHATMPFADHLVFLFFAAIFLLGFAIASAIIARVLRARARERSGS